MRRRWRIPLFTPSALPLEQWNTFRKFLVPDSVGLPIFLLRKNIKIPVLIETLKELYLGIKNGEYGLKLSVYFSAPDVSLYGYYGWDDTPFLDYSITYGEAKPPFPPVPNGLEISGSYKCLAVFGADAALPLGATVIRLEAVFFSQGYFLRSQDQIMKDKMLLTDVKTFEKRNLVSALAGIDWMPGGWTITACIILIMFRET